MEAETSWTNYPYSYITTYVPEESYTEQDEEEDDNNETTTFSIDSLLPNDLLERILSFLPIASIFRAGTVCKRWNDIVSSRRFLWNNSASQKPWYFMFTSSDEPSGYVYDPVIRKWYGNFDLPCIETSNWFIASSCGLICFMDNDSRNKIYVSNPITKQWRRLLEPPGHKSTDYTAMSINNNRGGSNNNHYNVSVVKSKQVPGNFFEWDVSIHVYESETMMWRTMVVDVLSGWRGGDESVIVDNILYFLIYSTGGGLDHRHGLISTNLDSSSNGFLMKSFIPMPCAITCGRLMNLRDKVVIVGGIGKHDRPEIIKGIGIWVLRDNNNNGKKWEECARMPQRYFQGFGEFDDVFASSGFDDLVYIQSYGSPALLTFDMSLKYWKWSLKCPVSKRFPLQLFTGFCFEPRLEIAP